jgi:bacterioferritin-associated ferredoxin
MDARVSAWWLEGCNTGGVRRTLFVVAYVCLCNGVSERKVRRAIDRGADSINAVAAACGAGTTCHGCHDTIDDLIDERCVAMPRLARVS